METQITGVVALLYIVMYLASIHVFFNLLNETSNL